jgi:uncharacterized protein with PIN domain
MEWRKRLLRLVIATIREDGFEFEAAGRIIVCRQCGGTRFFPSKAQLNTKDMTVLRLDFFDKSASTLRCKNCGFVYWFGKRPANRTWLKPEPCRKDGGRHVEG